MLNVSLFVHYFVQLTKRFRSSNTIHFTRKVHALETSNGIVYFFFKIATTFTPNYEQ